MGARINTVHSMYTVFIQGKDRGFSEKRVKDEGTEK